MYLIWSMAKKQYIKNKELYEEVVRCKQTGQMSDLLARAFIQIAERYSTKPNFIAYTYREDMVGEAIVQLCKGWDKFNPEKTTNAFSYYTQITHNAFIQFLNKERKQRNVRDELLVDAGLSASWTYQDEHSKSD